VASEYTFQSRGLATETGTGEVKRAAPNLGGGRDPAFGVLMGISKRTETGVSGGIERSREGGGGEGEEGGVARGWGVR